MNPDSTISLQGMLDYTRAEELARLAEALAGGTRVVLDLSDVTYLDSIGIGMMIRIRKSAGSCAIAGASPSVRRLFDVTGLSGVFDFI